MSGRQRAALLLGAAALTALAASPAAAQEPETSFGEVVQVRIVDLDVYVTDKKGNRVDDLRREDFQVFEDGKPVEITNFVRLGPQETVPAAVQPLPLPDLSTPAPERAPAVDENRTLHLLVYVDNLHTRPFNRNRVFAQVRQFLREVPAGTRLMLVTYEREVHVQEGFTTDRQLLIDKSIELEEKSSLAVQRETERDTLIRRLRGNQDLDSAVDDIDFYAKSVYNDVEVAVKALSATVAKLAGLPGRKALVYVSDGLDARPGEDLLTMVYDQFSQNAQRTALPQLSNRYSTRELFRELTNMANAHRVTFYTIDAGGLRASAATAADRGGSQTTDADTTWQLNRQDPLTFMADETGGLATIGTNNFAGGFQEVAADLRACYSLAIRPRSQNGDGRFHKLEVKVARPGLELRYRDGYRDKSAATQLEESTLAAALFGDCENGLKTGCRNPLGIEMVFLTAQAQDGDLLLPIELRIPIGRMALLPLEKLARGSLRVALAVADEHGDLSAPSQQVVPLEIPLADLEQAKRQVFVYTASLRIAPGRHRVVATVRDEIAGTDSFALRGVDLPRP